MKCEKNLRSAAKRRALPKGKRVGDIYVYEYENKTYINLTNRCNNNCDFCIRKNGDGLAGNRLWLKREPEAVDVISALKERPHVSDEVVFCGYGEPTMRLEVLKEVAEYIKKQGKSVRVNTNGLASEYHGRDIVPEIKNCVDTVSISLNESDAEKYDAVCHSIYGRDAYGHMLDFAQKCAESDINTVLTVVDVIPPEDIEICRKTAESVGASLRVRSFISDNDMPKKKKRVSAKKFPFPFIAISAYLILGFAFKLWHPGWLIFLSVPAYYAVADFAEKRRK